MLGSGCTSHAEAAVLGIEGSNTSVMQRTPHRCLPVTASSPQATSQPGQGLTGMDALSVGRVGILGMAFGCQGWGCPEHPLRCSTDSCLPTPSLHQGQPHGCHSGMGHGHQDHSLRAIRILTASSGDGTGCMAWQHWTHCQIPPHTGTMCPAGEPHPRHPKQPRQG